MFTLFVDCYGEVNRDEVIVKVTEQLHKPPYADRATWGTQVDAAQRVKLAEYGPPPGAVPKRKEPKVIES